MALGAILYTEDQQDLYPIIPKYTLWLDHPLVAYVPCRDGGTSLQALFRNPNFRAPHGHPHTSRITNRLRNLVYLSFQFAGGIYCTSFVGRTTCFRLQDLESPDATRQM